MIQNVAEFKQESSVLALAMLDWHGGGGSAIYQIGSTMYAGHLDQVASMFRDNGEYTSIAQRAIAELHSNDDSDADQLANQLEAWYSCYLNVLG